MKAIRLIKFFFDAMYYQFFIFNRDKFRLENPHERTVMLFCGLLFLPAIVLIYPLVKDIKKKRGIEIMREKPLLFGSQRFSCIMSWVIYPLWVILLYFIITHRHWLRIV